MGTASSKLKKYVIHGDEFAALRLIDSNKEFKKKFDPNASYGESCGHNSALHFVAKNAMRSLLWTLIYNYHGKPNSMNNENQNCFHLVCTFSGTVTNYVEVRRAQCLDLLLNCNLESLDFLSGDRRGNAPLHYAAQSGLQKCVEILIKKGASVFLPNGDGLTPCDFAEQQGHSAIAGYLEKIMVFQEESKGSGVLSDDQVHLQFDQVYESLKDQELQETKDQLIVETADMFKVPLYVAEALLKNHAWSKQDLFQSWLENPFSTCHKSGVPVPLYLLNEHVEECNNHVEPDPVQRGLVSLPNCDICARDLAHDEQQLCLDCRHAFCYSCWKSYLQFKIQEGNVAHLSCPAFECQQVVPVDIVEKVVGKGFASKFQEFDIKAFVESNPIMKWCPFPECGRAVKLKMKINEMVNDVLAARKTKNMSIAVSCDNGHYFCWKCLKEGHEPTSCEHWQGWLEKIGSLNPSELEKISEEQQTAATSLWLVSHSKPCPSCDCPIQKNDGCNHMKCSKCKHEFCWVCLGPWKEHSGATGGYFHCNRDTEIRTRTEKEKKDMDDAQVKHTEKSELHRLVKHYRQYMEMKGRLEKETAFKTRIAEKAATFSSYGTIQSTDLRGQFLLTAYHELLQSRNVLLCSVAFIYFNPLRGKKMALFKVTQSTLLQTTEVISALLSKQFMTCSRADILKLTDELTCQRQQFIQGIVTGFHKLTVPETVRNYHIWKWRNLIGGSSEKNEEILRLVELFDAEPSKNSWLVDSRGRHTNVKALVSDLQMLRGGSSTSTNREALEEFLRLLEQSKQRNEMSRWLSDVSDSDDSLNDFDEEEHMAPSMATRPLPHIPNVDALGPNLQLALDLSLHDSCLRHDALDPLEEAQLNWAIQLSLLENAGANHHSGAAAAGESSPANSLQAASFFETAGLGLDLPLWCRMQGATAFDPLEEGEEAEASSSSVSFVASANDQVTLDSLDIVTQLESIAAGSPRAASSSNDHDLSGAAASPQSGPDSTSASKDQHHDTETAH